MLLGICTSVTQLSVTKRIKRCVITTITLGLYPVVRNISFSGTITIILGPCTIPVRVDIRIFISGLARSCVTWSRVIVLVPLNLPSTMILRMINGVLRTSINGEKTMGVIYSGVGTFKVLFRREIGMTLRRTLINYRNFYTWGEKYLITGHLLRYLVGNGIDLPVYAIILNFYLTRRRTYIVTLITLFINITLLGLSFVKCKRMISKCTYVRRVLRELCTRIDRLIVRVLTIFVLNGNRVTMTINKVLDVLGGIGVSIVLSP